MAEYKDNYFSKTHSRGNPTILENGMAVRSSQTYDIAFTENSVGLKNFYFEWQWIEENSKYDGSCMFVGFINLDSSTRFDGHDTRGENRYLPWPHAYMYHMNHMRGARPYPNIENLYRFSGLRTKDVQAGWDEPTLYWNDWNKDRVYACGVETIGNSTRVSTYVEGELVYVETVPWTYDPAKNRFLLCAQYKDQSGAVRMNFGKNGFKYPEVARKFMEVKTRFEDNFFSKTHSIGGPSITNNGLTAETSSAKVVAVSEYPVGRKNFYYEFSYSKLSSNSRFTVNAGFAQFDLATTCDVEGYPTSAGGANIPRYFVRPHSFSMFWLKDLDDQPGRYTAFYTNSEKLSWKEFVITRQAITTSTVFSIGVCPRGTGTQIRFWVDGVWKNDWVIPWRYDPKKTRFFIQSNAQTVSAGAATFNFGKNGFKYPALAENYEKMNNDSSLHWNVQDQIDPNAHGIHLWREAPEVYDYFPCTKDIKGICNRPWQYHNQITFNKDAELKSGYLHFDNTNGKDAVLTLPNVDLGSSVAIDYWFRFSDTKQWVHIDNTWPASNFAVFYQNDGAYKLQSFCCSNAETENKTQVGWGILPSIWHHYYCYIIDGKRFHAAVDGHWIGPEVQEISKFKNVSHMMIGGWEDNRPEIRTNKDFKSVVDIKNIRILRTSTPPFSDIGERDFVPPSIKGANYKFKDGKVYELVTIPSIGMESWKADLCAHAHQEWAPEPEVMAYLPCNGNANDVCGNTWNNVNNLARYLETDAPSFTKGYLRFDFTSGKTSNYSCPMNLGGDYGIDFWFRIPDNKCQLTELININPETDIQILYQNNQYKLWWYVANYNAPEAVGQSFLSEDPITPNVWHHIYVYMKGQKKACLAYDGKWIIQELNSNHLWAITMMYLGGWYQNADSGANSPYKSYFDLTNIRILKTTNLPWDVDKNPDGFAPPVHLYEYRKNGSTMQEHRAVPFFQNALESPFMTRNGKYYGMDPMVDIFNYHNEDKVFHVTNVNGVPQDITGQTTWGTYNSFYAEGLGREAPLRTYKDGKWAYLYKTGGRSTSISSDFTFLADFRIDRKSTYVPPSSQKDEGWMHSHYLCFGEGSKALESSINEVNDYVSFTINGSWHSIPGTEKIFKYGKWHRIIIQRRKSWVRVWMDGIYTANIQESNMGKEIRNLFGGFESECTNLNGAFRNAILWNKAVFGDGDVDRNGTETVVNTQGMDQRKYRSAKIVEPPSSLGVVLNAPGNTYGDWRRIDRFGNNVDLTHDEVLKRWPFTEIKPVTVDGQHMIRLPRIYVNNTIIKEGPYAGKHQYSISSVKFDKSWHCHPAFMLNGMEMRALDIAAYIASKDAAGKAASVPTTSYWTNITRDTAHTLGESRNVKNGTWDQWGWHMYSIYDHHLLARLMLIEFATGNIQLMLTGSNVGSNMNYHGITHEFGGTDGCWSFFLDGADVLGSGNTTRIFDSQGFQKYVETHIVLPQDNWMATCQHTCGANFDFGDIFAPETGYGDSTKSAFGDATYFRYGKVITTCNHNTMEHGGPFGVGSLGKDETLTNNGFRLSRYVA